MVSIVSKWVKTAPKAILWRNYRQYGHNKLKDDLKYADWSPVYISHSISDSLQAFNRILTEFFDWHAPFVTKRANTNISFWLTVELKNKMSSSIYKVIRPVLNFFFTIRFHKYKKALKSIKKY